MKLAVLDDYLGHSLRLADWAAVPDLLVVPIREHVADPDRLVALLSGFDAVLCIRERQAAYEPAWNPDLRPATRNNLRRVVATTGLTPLTGADP